MYSVTEGIACEGGTVTIDPSEEYFFLPSTLSKVYGEKIVVDDRNHLATGVLEDFLVEVDPSKGDDEDGSLTIHLKVVDYRDDGSQVSTEWRMSAARSAADLIDEEHGVLVLSSGAERVMIKVL